MTKEDALLASLYVNLKGSKTKKEDWISIATKLNKIAKTSKSRKIVAEELGVSPELIRSILSLLDLPKEAKQLVREGKILFDAAQRLNTIKKENRVNVSREIVGLKSHQQREIIQYAKKYPNSSLSNYKKRVIVTPKTEKIQIAVIPLKEKTFQVLQKECKRRKISLEKILLHIIEGWIEKRSNRK